MQAESDLDNTDDNAVSEKDDKDEDKDETKDDADVDEPYPTMTFALFLYWVLPILLLSIFGRIGVDTSEPRIPFSPQSVGPAKSVQITPASLEKAYLAYERKRKEFERQQQQDLNDQDEEEEDYLSSETNHHPRRNVSTRPSPSPTSFGFDTSSWPTAYRETLNRIRKRRPEWHHGPPVVQDSKSVSKATVEKDSRRHRDKKQEAPAPTHFQNPQHAMLYDTIQQLKKEYELDPSDVFNALMYADAMRQWGVTVFDGGSFDQRAIEVYTTVLVQLRQNRKAAQRQGLYTDQSQDGTRNVASEYQLTYGQKSIDGMLCSVYTSLGKLYFMASMFELSEKVLSYCIDMEPKYLEALNARGSTRIVMGKYDRAAEDYAMVITNDVDHLFNDAYTGLVRVLEASESSVPSGWSFVVDPLEALIENFELALQVHSDNYVQALSDGLRRFHHALFIYHDKKTKNYSAAWNHLMESHKYKLRTLPGYSYGNEKSRLEQIKKVFGKGFWPDGMGSTTKAPIFVIGFARSGSTLLERVLDAHPSIAGLGENSVFNGRLDSIRQRFVEASAAGGHEIPNLAVNMGLEVVKAMKERWEVVDKNTAKDSGTDPTQATPQRFVDKMLTNYFNIGFIQMLFPEALILHVIREPMDTVFSAFKHDFPSDRLAYTADERALVELYTVYRETMEHWEDVLPGRITHVRYEDMVDDMPGMARAIIDAAGLDWHDSVLDFHKQKHYVNTYSTTQVRKQVYKDAVKAWKRYETQLEPLVNLLGDRAKYDQATTLPGYKKPVNHDEL
ncbi:hypothetical protein ACA910_003961 [Epithemia clementina (nom. ined.)]